MFVYTAFSWSLTLLTLPWAAVPARIEQCKVDNLVVLAQFAPAPLITGT
jgi:hypothetical protein